MGSISINFAEVESSFEPLPEGTYDVIIERVEVRESQSSDNDYLNWDLVVQDEEFEDRHLWMMTSLSEKALWRLKDVLLALGVIEDDEELELEWEDDIDIQPREGPLVTLPELDGIAAEAVVTNEVYDGRERNRVNELRSAAAPAPKKKAGAAGTTKAKAGAKKSGNGRRRKLR